MGRQRMRPVRRQPPPPPASGAPAAAAPVRPVPKPRWRQTLDSYGGLWTLATLAAAVLVVGAIVVASARSHASSAASTDALMGDEITSPPAEHVASASQLVIPPGAPPTGGPHYAPPQALGIYDSPVPDGNAIHSLEHGIVWISYHPDKVDAAGVQRLRDLVKQYANDVILAPRADNATAVAAASWGRLLKQDNLDTDELKRFITTNRNRSPEPGVRDNIPMRVPGN